MKVAAFMVTVPRPRGACGDPNQNHATLTPSSNSKYTQDPPGPRHYRARCFPPPPSTTCLVSTYGATSKVLVHTPTRRLAASLCQGPEGSGQGEHPGPQGDGKRSQIPRTVGTGGRAGPGPGTGCGRKGLMRKVTPGVPPQSGQ